MSLRGWSGMVSQLRSPAFQRITTLSWESVKAGTRFIVSVFCLYRVEEGGGDFWWGEMRWRQLLSITHKSTWAKMYGLCLSEISFSYSWTTRQLTQALESKIDRISTWETYCLHTYGWYPSIEKYFLGNHKTVCPVKCLHLSEPISLSVRWGYF